MGGEEAHQLQVSEREKDRDREREIEMRWREGGCYLIIMFSCCFLSLCRVLQRTLSNKHTTNLKSKYITITITI